MKNNITGKSVNYTDGEVVFEKGSDGKELYRIVSGKAEVSQEIGGKKEIVTILENGKIFGEMAALNDNVRTMTITAIGDLHLHELSWAEVINNHEILKDLCIDLARRLQTANLRIKELILNMIANSKRQGPESELVKILKERIEKQDNQIERLEDRLSAKSDRRDALNQLLFEDKSGSWFQRIFRRRGINYPP